MAGAAAVGLEDLQPGSVGAIGRSARILEPFLKLRRGHRQDGERHQGVGDAAVLGALPAERAGPVGLQREAVRPSRDHVHLAAERRDPEGMDDVGAVEHELDPLADRHADLVGRHDILTARLAVPHLPPILTGCHLDAQLRRRGDGPWPQHWHQPEGIGEQGGEHEHGECNARPEDEPRRGVPAPGTPVGACGEQKRAQHTCPDQAAADGHYPEQHGDVSGFRSCRVQRRLLTATRGDKAKEKKRQERAHE